MGSRLRRAYTDASSVYVPFYEFCTATRTEQTELRLVWDICLTELVWEA